MMRDINVLIVEDESIVAMELDSYIHNKLGYNVIDICSNANDALRIMEEESIDIILMDICIKGELDGIELSEIILEKYPRTQIIFLTAHMDDYNVERAIKLDPVAYLSKPFNREELRVVMKIAVQRMNNAQRKIFREKHHIFFDEEYCYDTHTQMLFCCGEQLHLTKKESELLDLFVRYRNRLVDVYTIEHTLWPDKETSTNTIRTLVRRVREKLKHKFIETVATQGYQLNIPVTPAK
jgi:DNA-binding response OmpR family regulator